MKYLHLAAVKVVNISAYVSIIILLSCSPDRLQIDQFEPYNNSPRTTDVITINNYDGPKLESIPSLSKFPNLHKIDLSNNDLSKIPGELSEIRNLDSVEFRSNKITTIENQFFEANKLMYLNLAQNKLRRIPETIKNLKKLKHLDVSKNKIRQLPDAIMHLNALECLSLSNNTFDDLPSDIKKMSRLKKLSTLDLSDMRLKEIPENISLLTNLHELNLSDNAIAKMPSSFSKLTKLTKLKMSGYEIHALPADFFESMNIKELDLSGGDSASAQLILERATSIAGLRSLDLSNCDLRKLPKDFANLQNLEELHLSYNDFRNFNDLYETLSKMPKIRTLYLSGSRSNYLEGIGKVKSIRTLSIGDDSLTSIPADIGKLKHLKELSVYFSAMSTLPTELSELDSLESLTIFDTELKTIPQFIYRIPSLKSLSLSSCGISHLSDSIALSKSLESLTLSNNDLVEIPIEIESLSNLEHLDLSSNKLNKFYPNISKLSRLKTLNLSDNLFDTISVNPGPPALTMLDLHSNRLKYVPTGVASLPNLVSLNLSNNNIGRLANLKILTDVLPIKELNLSDNSIEIIPDEIVRLNNLESLDISDNPIKEIPQGLHKLKKLKMIKAANLDVSNCLLQYLFPILKFFAFIFGATMFYCSIFLFENQYGNIENKLQNYLNYISIKSKTNLYKANVFLSQVIAAVLSLINKLWSSRLFSIQSLGVSAAFSCAFFSFYFITALAEWGVSDSINVLYWFSFGFFLIALTPLVKTRYTKWIPILLTICVSFLFEYAFYVLASSHQDFKFSHEMLLSPPLVLIVGSLSTIVYLKMLKKWFLNSQSISWRLVMYILLSVIVMCFYISLVLVVPAIIIAVVFLSDSPPWIHSILYYLILSMLSIGTPFIIAVFSVLWVIAIILHRLVIWTLNMPLFAIYQHKLVRNRRALAAAGVLLITTSLPSSYRLIVESFLKLFT